MPTELSTATRITGTSIPGVSRWPNTPSTKAIFKTQLKQEPSMCMVAPRGSTMSATSLLMPVSAASSMLVGMVATDEQVPSDTTAGLVMWRNMVFTPPLPPPNQAKRGQAVKM